MGGGGEGKTGKGGKKPQRYPFHPAQGQTNAEATEKGRPFKPPASLFHYVKPMKSGRYNYGSDYLSKNPKIMHGFPRKSKRFTLFAVHVALAIFCSSSRPPPGRPRDKIRGLRDVDERSTSVEDSVDSELMQAAHNEAIHYHNCEEIRPPKDLLPSLHHDAITRAKIAGDTFVQKKAGMSGVDKVRVAKVVEEMTKGTPFYQNQLKRAETQEKRLQTALKGIRDLEPGEWRRIETYVNHCVKRLEDRKLHSSNRTYAVVDMDAFFAKVEERDNPSLRGIPFAVGGKSMISTANYEARKFGVRSAMPGFIALKLCPSLKLVPGDFKKYSKASAELKSIVKAFDPGGVMYSLDEAYLDLTPYLRNLANPRKIPRDFNPPVSPALAARVAAEIRRRVRNETQGLTASVGVGGARFIAKMAADANKPDGQLVIPHKEGLTFVRSQSIRAIGGIGKATERPYAKPLVGTKDSTSFLLYLWASGEVGGVRPGRCVSLKIKFASFETITRSHRQPSYVSNREEIYKAARKLLDAEWSRRSGFRARLLGVRVSEFIPKGYMNITDVFLSQAPKSVRGANSSILEAESGKSEKIPEGSRDLKDDGDLARLDVHCKHPDPLADMFSSQLQGDRFNNQSRNCHK
ncbi:hypothetical protein AAMO2058_000603500 [Amorphochlora amoebiformis]